MKDLERQRDDAMQELSNKEVLVSNWWSNLPDTFCSAWNDIDAVRGKS